MKIKIIIESIGGCIVEIDGDLTVKAKKITGFTGKITIDCPGNRMELVFQKAELGAPGDLVVHPDSADPRRLTSLRWEGRNRRALDVLNEPAVNRSLCDAVKDAVARESSRQTM